MPDADQQNDSNLDPEVFSDIAERSQRLVSDFLGRHAGELQSAQPDASHIGDAFMEMTARLMSDPAKLIEAQVNLWHDYMTLWQATATKMMGGDAAPVIEPERGDREAYQRLRAAVGAQAHPLAEVP